ncbi:MAG: 16S rRNA (uracil(1498)-N(3))-methyltransferase [Planctomycetaceae bacterium]|nr:16S rRNA (uracil(1498)-N(3))-methyltransferase [Planctomycetaceae bacterium]
MADRYFVSQPIAGDRVVLSEAEAHHLARVMRAQPGDEVVLFDGTGGEYRARLEQVTRHEVRLSVGPRLEIDREARLRVTLGVALPKGDRQRWLIEKAVELGVARLIPLETQRGVAQPAANTLERLARGVIEAAKQCGRNRLMEVAAAASWSSFVGAAPGGSVRLLAHPAGEMPADAGAAKPLSLLSPPHSLAAQTEVWIAVGPEGGLTADEVRAALDQDWQAVDLGARILRVETAALALAGAYLLG